jgi:hypothetical protein
MSDHSLMGRKNNLLIYKMNGIVCLAFVFVAGVYNFTRPTTKRESPIEPRNEIMNRPDHFMMGNQYSPKFNKK